MTPFPLSWPDNIPRWKGTREAGLFKTTLAGAMTNVQDSLRKFATDSGKQITGLVISSNVTLGVNRPDDPGVAIWFSWDGLSVCIPVDRYSKVESNLQAIHHVVEARRTEMRHGTLALVRASFAGFMALPPPPGSKPKRPWRQVFDMPADWKPTAAALTARYRDLAKERQHKHEQLLELNLAREAANEEVSNG